MLCSSKFPSITVYLLEKWIFFGASAIIKKLVLPFIYIHVIYIRVLENREMAGKEFGGEYFGGACATRSTSCVWLGYTERASERACVRAHNQN